MHLVHEHSSWIVGMHLRYDVPEVITASYNGSIKFFDIRTMRSFRTRETHKGQQTAMVVHPRAPIMATGTTNQMIKVSTLNGEQLNMIRFHEGWAGQRIGPVSSLAFHPTQTMFAAGATDGIVSIYSTEHVF